MPRYATRAGPPPEGPARHVQLTTKPTEPCSRATVARDVDRSGQEQEPGARSPSGRAPAMAAKDDVVRGDSGCDCSTYCAECRLWPFRAALSGTWRALEALDRAA